MNPFQRQDDGGPLGVFLDGRLIAEIPDGMDTDRAYTFRDSLADEHGVDRATYEVLKSCAKHPDVSAVDCLDCWPLKNLRGEL